MIHTKYFRLLLLCCIPAAVTAQRAEPVALGQNCPDLPIKNIINYQTTDAHISDFKGKLLILDFWATWCAPCLSMIPVSEKLQKQFEGKIQIMPVTDQPTAEVKAFLQKRAQTTGVLPPTATGDVSLNAAFPHKIVPHYVWISKEGKVLAITSYGALNENNIRLALEGKSLSVREKTDEEKTIDESQPMFHVANLLLSPDGNTLDTVKTSDVLYHSVLTGFLPGFYCEAGADSTRITSKNSSVGGLYRIAAGRYDIRKLLLNSTIWEAKNPRVLAYTDSAIHLCQTPEEIMPWMEAHTFCYELKFPPAMQQQKYDMMLADLNNYFGAMLGIYGSMEKRKVKCLALKCVDTGLIISGGGEKLLRYDAYNIALCNQTMQTLITVLGINLDGLPAIIDKTNYQGHLDIAINANMNDLNAVNNALKTFGLTLTEEENLVDMIVIRDKE